MILPGTRSMWNKWWHEFMKWIIFAPVYAFFIYLTVSIINKNTLYNILNQSNAAYADGLTITSFLGSNLGFVANYVVLIIFMVAGLVFARSSGIVGATALSNWGTDLRKFGVRVASRWQAGGAKVPFAGRISEKLGITQRLNNMIAKGGWQKGIATALRAPGATKSFLASKTNREVWVRALATMKQRADESAFTAPAASIVGMWENIKRAGSLGGKTFISDTNTPEEKEKKIKELQERIMQKRLAGEEGYEYGKIDQILRENGFDPTDMSPEAQQMRGEFMEKWDREQAEQQYKTSYAKSAEVTTGPIRALRNIFSDQNVHVENAKQALIARRMQEYGRIKDEDTLVNHYMQAKDPKDKEALLRILASINGLNTLFFSMGKAFDAGKLKNYIREAFTAEDAARIAADISATGAANGNFSYVGMTKFDPTLGKTRFANDDEQIGIIRQKIDQLEAQQFDRTVHPDSFRGFDEKGNRAFNIFGDATLSKIGLSHAEHAHRFQPRTRAELTAIIRIDEGKLAKEFLREGRARQVLGLPELVKKATAAGSSDED
jgi:hypothetical protein